MKIKKRTRNILIGVVVLVLIGGIYAYTEYVRKPADLAGAKADVTLSATQLLGEFSKDEKAANQKYLNKITSVQGILKSIDKDHTGSISLSLDAGDPLEGVSCELDARHLADADNVHVGDNVTVTGICTGMLTDVVLVRCSAQKK
jgi:hypothetical protein